MTTGGNRILSFSGGRENLREADGEGFSLAMTGDCCPSDSVIDALRAGRRKTQSPLQNLL